MNTLELFKNDQEHVEYKAGEVIFSQGDTADKMYVVKEGQVEIISGDTVVDTAGVGELLGEMALIDSSARSATAKAKSDSCLIPIDEKRFTFLVQQTPFFSLHVMRVLVERLRNMNQTVAGR